MAVSLGLRLVFEQNLFSYYFMALSVSLVLLDVAGGRIRSSLLAWLAAVALVLCFFHGLAFNFVGWGSQPRSVVPLFVLIPALVMILVRILRGGIRGSRDLLPWLAVAACGLFMWPNVINPFYSPGDVWFWNPLHIWVWQIVLVGPGLVLAARPLLSDVRLHGSQPRRQETERVPEAT